MVVRLVWDQEVAGSNPVSPTFINTGTMKKFSQYINSHEDCDCNQVQEELSFGMPMSIGSFAKGAAIGVAKTIGRTAVEKLGGKLGAAALEGGKAGDKEHANVVDAKLTCKEKSLGLKKQIASAKSRLKTAQNRGDADEEKDYQGILDDLELELQHHDNECSKIQSSRNMHDVEKAKLAGSKERLAALSKTP